MAQTRRRQGYLEQYNSKNGKWERVRSTQPKGTAKPSPQLKGATGARPMGTADVGPKGPVGQLGQRTGMTVKPPATAAKPAATSVGGRLGRAVLGGAVLSAIAGKAADTLGKAADMKQWERVQAELKQREASYKAPKPQVAKPGQKGAVTPQRSATTKSETVGSNQPSGATGGRTTTTPAGRSTSRFAGARDREFNRVRNMGSGATDTSPNPPAPSTARSGSTSSGSGGGTRSSAPASKPAAPAKPKAPASSKDRRVSAATANREAGNYGTSRTNNPMIDDTMKARMRQREEAAGVGPVKDGARYAADVKSSTRGVGPVADGGKYVGNLKPSTSNTTTAKKKEDETKTMSIAERIRRRRAGLA